MENIFWKTTNNITKPQKVENKTHKNTATKNKINIEEENEILQKTKNKETNQEI